MSVRIVCINKDSGNHENRFVAISYLGWVEEATGKTGKISREEMYRYLAQEKGSAYVKDSRGDIAYLMAAISSRGTKYVKTVADETKADNLLMLPEC